MIMYVSPNISYILAAAQLQFSDGGQSHKFPAIYEQTLVSRLLDKNIQTLLGKNCKTTVLHLLDVWNTSENFGHICIRIFVNHTYTHKYANTICKP